MANIASRVFSLLSLILLLSGSVACISVDESGNVKNPPPPPPSATVALDSRPGMAEVSIDGEFRGTAPVRLDLLAGTHKIEFRLRGYQTWTRDLVVVAGDDTNVVATLERVD